MSTQITRRQLIRTLGAGAAGGVILGASGCGGGSTSSSGTTQLRLSHQWPKAASKQGDFRARLAQKFAARVADQTRGRVEIQIYPNASLIDPEEQYKSVTQGTIDMTLVPVVYAVGEHPIFGVTDLPGLIKNHTQAQNWQTTEIGRRLEKIFEESGTKILVWNWNSTCIGVREGSPVVRPDDIEQGAVWRGGGPEMEQLLQHAGASITSMDSSETYNAMQTGVIDGLVTSPASFRSYRLHEQTSSYTTSTENTLGFFFEPLLIAMDKYEQLPRDVRNAFAEAGSGLQDFAYEASERDDVVTEKTVESAGDTVAPIDDRAFAQWRELAEPVWRKFAARVPGGQELIDMALSVPEE
ncbi:MAG: TRAP transporter substrate-binding protein DctP [Carbonactinosporaceae bacterium]